MVSGALALLASVYKLSYKKLIEVLRETAEDLGFKKYEQGSGKIRIDKAYDRVRKWSG